MKKKSLLLVSVLVLGVLDSKLLSMDCVYQYYKKIVYDPCEQMIARLTSQDMNAVWLAAILSNINLKQSKYEPDSNKQYVRKDLCNYKDCTYADSIRSLLVSLCISSKATHLAHQHDKSMVNYLVCAVPFIIVFSVKKLFVQKQ